VKKSRGAELPTGVLASSSASRRPGLFPCDARHRNAPKLAARCRRNRAIALATPRPNRILPLLNPGLHSPGRPILLATSRTFHESPFKRRTDPSPRKRWFDARSEEKIEIAGRRGGGREDDREGMSDRPTGIHASWYQGICGEMAVGRADQEQNTASGSNLPPSTFIDVTFSHCSSTVAYT
jgi:hypothetical protein